ncbi:hypothetical protein [Nocardioides pantholopis]|uniref:hypothetical protein n=1 Tax=Nocardioides pantholopis TaxID=2483798 RepID=UPI000FD93A64|nr:hypothetical protein [Nocardioides pantholopis]
MQLYAVVVHEVLPLLVAATDEAPEPEDVKAGWTGFGVFLGLCVALAFLGWALTKQLRRTERNRDAGVFGPVENGPAETPVEITEEQAADEGHRPDDAAPR